MMLIFILFESLKASHDALSIFKISNLTTSFEKNVSGQREFTGPRPMTDVVECFVSEITLGQMPAHATMGLCIWRTLDHPPLQLHWRYTDFCQDKGEKNQAFCVSWNFPEHNEIQNHRCWDQKRSLLTFILTSGGMKHVSTQFVSGSCWFCLARSQLLESYPVLFWRIQRTMKSPFL